MLSQAVFVLVPLLQKIVPFIGFFFRSHRSCIATVLALHTRLEKEARRRLPLF